MTGTSIDGLDVCAIRIIQQDKVEFVAAADIRLPPSLAADLHRCARARDIGWNKLGTTDARLGEFIGTAVSAFLTQHAISVAEVAAIGSHGQTVHHAPDASPPFSTQIGDPYRVAAITGIPVVADFRRADIAAGGQGAPLVPPFHRLLFATEKCDRAVANIGGISNITNLPRNQPLSGFDTGPGNTLMDAWCQTNIGQPFDNDGDWARGGSVAEPLLQRLLADPYFARRPPKSTGPEYFNIDWLNRHVKNETAQDIQTTLVELSARSLVEALHRIHPICTELVLCGGGRKNSLLVKRLCANAAFDVIDCDQLGVDGDALEAAAFAWLASRTLAGLSGNEPAVTGARYPQILGGVVPPPTAQP
jgi:anhydro-N-acetylmuramic acid kinase